MPDKPAAKKFDYEAKKIFDKPDTAKLKNDKKGPILLIISGVVV